MLARCTSPNNVVSRSSVRSPSRELAHVVLHLVELAECRPKCTLIHAGLHEAAIVLRRPGGRFRVGELTERSLRIAERHPPQERRLVLAGERHPQVSPPLALLLQPPVGSRRLLQLEAHLAGLAQPFEHDSQRAGIDLRTVVQDRQRSFEPVQRLGQCEGGQRPRAGLHEVGQGGVGAPGGEIVLGDVLGPLRLQSLEELGDRGVHLRPLAEQCGLVDGLLGECVTESEHPLGDPGGLPDDVAPLELDERLVEAGE